jgi:hypothetical protein
MTSPDDKGVIKAVGKNEKIDITKAILIQSDDVVRIRKNKIENWPHLIDVFVAI